MGFICFCKHRRFTPPCPTMPSYQMAQQNSPHRPGHPEEGSPSISSVLNTEASQSPMKQEASINHETPVQETSFHSRHSPSGWSDRLRIKFSSVHDTPVQGSPVHETSAHETPDHEKHSSSSLSHRLRRKLSSIDSKCFQPISRRAERLSRLSLSRNSDGPADAISKRTQRLSRFSLSRSSDRAADPISPETGSSLMSEKGYDSDANFITTPKQSTEPSITTATIQMDMSPPKSCQTQTSGDIHDQPQEQEPDDAAKLVNELNLGPVAEPFDELKLGHTDEANNPHLALPPRTHTPLQLHQGLPGLNSAARIPSPLGNKTNLTVHDRIARSSRHVSMSERAVPSASVVTPPLSTHGDKARFYATVARHGLPGIQANVAEPSVSGSSESLSGPDSEIMVTETRRRASREPSSGVRSLHLQDMNISKMLRPSTSTCNDSYRTRIHSVPRLPSELVNKQKERSLSGQLHDLIQETEPRWDSFDFGFPITPSSVYSPRSSLRSRVVSSNCRFPSLNAELNNPGGSKKTAEEWAKEYRDLFSPIDWTRNKVGDASDHSSDWTLDWTSYDNLPDIPEPSGKPPVKSKFVEHFGINRPASFSRSVSNDSMYQGQDLPPRKISVGWMSGGRRLGYGYALVSGNGDENQEARNDLPASSEKACKAPTRGAKSKIQASKRSIEQVSSGSNSELPGSDDSSSLRRWSGATTLVKSGRTSESTDSSGRSSFWEKFTRQNSQDSPARMAAFRDRCYGADQDRYSQTDLVGRRGVLERWTDKHLPFGSGRDSYNAGGVVQTDPYVNQVVAHSKSRNGSRFRVFNHGRRHSSHLKKSDRHSGFPAKRSLWLHGGGTMHQKDSELAAHPALQDRPFGPVKYRVESGGYRWSLVETRGSFDRHSQ